MKTERYVLSALCVGVCIWAAAMIVGVTGLARTQGPSALLALFEVATFMAAGFLPLLLVWNSGAKKKMLIGIWAVCITYVSVLALNMLRLEFFTRGAVRMALWIAIAVLFARALRRSHKHAQLGGFCGAKPTQDH